MSQNVVTAELTLSLVVPGDEPVPVAARVRYDVTDPYAVGVTFLTGTDGEGVQWTFARQLLTDGVTRATGDGDIRVWPSHDGPLPTVHIHMTSPHGEARFETSMLELVEFLAETYLSVPTGSEGEHMDLDAEIAMLLSEG